MVNPFAEPMRTSVGVWVPRTSLVVAGSSMGDGRPLQTFPPRHIHPQRKVPLSVGARQMSAPLVCVSGRVTTGWRNLCRLQ